MSVLARGLLPSCCVLVAMASAAQRAAPVPVIWDDRSLDDWATPLASLKIRPAHYTATEFYAIPGDNLRTPKNPDPPAATLVKRGETVFRREKCGACHPAPNYTTGELTPALGFNVPVDHPHFTDVRDRSVGTDPGLALRTRKGTGFYKIPSLRGLWYRPRLLHDASIVSLEELFDAARLDPAYERKGWSPPGTTKGAVPGLEFLTTLSAEDKKALIAFLRSL